MYEESEPLPYCPYVAVLLQGGAEQLADRLNCLKSTMRLTRNRSGYPAPYSPFRSTRLHQFGAILHCYGANNIFPVELTVK